jgi:hypothetical protein
MLSNRAENEAVRKQVSAETKLGFETLKGNALLKTITLQAGRRSLSLI